MSKDFMSNDSTGSTESSYFYEEYTFEEITIESSDSSYIEVSIADDENDTLDEKSVSRAQEEISRKSTSEGRTENVAPGLDLMLWNRSDGRDSGSAASGFDVESRNCTRHHSRDGSVLNECIKSPTIRTDSTSIEGFELRLSRPRLTRELSALTECFKLPPLEAASRYKLGDESPLDYDLRRPTYTRHLSALTTEWLNPSIASSLLDESHAESANDSLAEDVLVVPQLTRQVSGLNIASLRDATQHENDKIAAASFDLVIPSLPRQLSALTVTGGFESQSTSSRYPSESHTPNKPRRTSEAEAFAARFNGRVMPKHSHHVNSFAQWSNHTSCPRSIPEQPGRLDSVIEGKTSASLNKKELLAADQSIRKKRTTQMAVKDADLSSAMEKRAGGLGRIPNNDKKVASADKKTKEKRRNASHVVKLEKKRRHTFTSVGKTECSTAPSSSLLQQRISTSRELRSSCRVSHQQQGRKVLISNIKSDRKSPKAPNHVPRRRQRNTDSSSKALTNQSGKNQGDSHAKKDPPGARLKYVPSSNLSKVTRSTTELSQSSSCAGHWQTTRRRGQPNKARF
jgi:hypothetical protein